MTLRMPDPVVVVAVDDSGLSIVNWTMEEMLERIRIEILKDEIGTSRITSYGGSSGRGKKPLNPQ